MSPASFEHDELKYWFLGGITNDATKNPQTFRNDPAQKAVRVKDKPPLWYARTVGGTSVHFTANYWRFHDDRFQRAQPLGAIPGAPVSTIGRSAMPNSSRTTRKSSGRSACPAWPARALSIRRARKPYPMPPLPVKSSGVLFERGARKLGLHPFPAPMAINSQPYRGRPACVHCGFCHGFACEVQGKSSTSVLDDSGS